MHRVLFFSFLIASGCGAAADVAPSPEPVPEPSVGPPPPAPPPGTTRGACSGPPPGPGYECVQDCGPPVARQDDPPPGHSWLSADDAANRRQFGCPICLPGEVQIATPAGPVAVSALEVGDAIWTLDERGERQQGRVLFIRSRPLRGPHEVVRVTLADGRTVTASPGHPTLTGESLGALARGAALSGSIVVASEQVAYGGTRLWDLWPSGTTRAYWADGVILRSSFGR